MHDWNVAMGNVMMKIYVGPVAAAALLLAAPGSTQTRVPEQAPVTAAAGADVDAHVEPSGQIQLMEQALEQAVQVGLRVVERRLPPVALGLAFFAGPIQARGFDLDGYGVFFDVEYPVVRRSVLWSLQTLDQIDRGMAVAMRELQRQMRVMEDSALRRPSPARGFDDVPSVATPVAPVALGAGTGDVRVEPDLMPTSPPEPVVVDDATTTIDWEALDPQATYMTALEDVLTSVVVTYGARLAIAIGDDEWLTIAAREGRARVGPMRSAPSTMTLRIRGRDLRALSEGRLSGPDARTRVETAVH